MSESPSSSIPNSRRYEVVGTRPIRHDGVEKVTGQARYGADIRLPGMLYGKVLRSPHAHARIKAIDTSRAAAFPGVHAVVTAADLVQHSGRITDISEGTMHNLRFMSHNTLAADKVLYKGHAIAAVAATSVHVAEEALALIDVEYDVLSPVMTVAEAMREDAPLLHERLASVTMAPLDFRMLNSAKEGTRRATGPVFPRIGFIETLQAAKQHPHYTAPLHGPYRGRGVASGFWFNGSGPASALALVNPDGTVSLTEGSPDIGGSRTSAAQHCAEVLGLPVTDIRPAVGDTDAIGFTSVTGGSSVTFKTGWAVYEASQDVKRQMRERAAKIWECPVDEVVYEAGVLLQSTDATRRLTFKQLAARQVPTGGPIMGRAGVNPAGPGSALATHIVDVEVDPETGKVQILRYTAIQDVGKAIHPSYVEGQMQGGSAQGIGWALHEEYLFNERGHMLNGSFLDYRMPVCLDLPMIDTVLVEVPNPNHPFGVRGVGEVPIVPPMAAIANAIYRAIGLRFNHLPMSPGCVLEALGSQDVSRNGAHSHAVRGAATHGTTERPSENGVQEGRDGVHTPAEVLTNV